MSKSFLPGTDAGLLSWSSNFSTMITATPTAYGLVAGDATAYAAKHSAFSTALATATIPTTRTKPSIAAKRTAAQTLRDAASFLSKRIQGVPTITVEQKEALGLDVRSPNTPVIPPGEAPVTEIVEMNGWMAKFKVRPSGSEGRSSRAPGAAMLFIYSYVGTAAPMNTDDYNFEGPSSRANFDVSFDAGLAVGTRVWVTCCWVTARGLTSPACTPIGLLIGGGVPEVMAA